MEHAGLTRIANCWHQEHRRQCAARGDRYRRRGERWERRAV